MTRFHFERPDGIRGKPQTSLIHLNEFVPPQGFGGDVIPPPVGESALVQTNTLSALVQTGTLSALVQS